MSSLVSGPSNDPSSGADPANSGSPEFGRTWWGRAWLEALEQRARLDPDRLPRGREYARSGAVGDLTLAPGEARARVRGRKTEPYQVRIRVRPFTDDEWDRVLEAVTARLGHAAALLDGELPPEIADDAASAGLDLLPGGGEVGPRCDCPDDADPCKHSAAVCYLVADALDADPFTVLLLRGRTRGEVLAGLRARRRGLAATQPAASGQGGAPGVAWALDGGAAGGTPDGASHAPADPGVDARDALLSGAAPGPVPVPPLPAARPGHPAALPMDPPAWRAGLRDDLLSLAADAARRAWELAVGLTPDAGLSLDQDRDLARRAENALGTPAFAALAANSDTSGQELTRQALAWRYGAASGLEVLRNEWDPGTEAAGAAELMKAARTALRDAAGAPTRITRNRVTAGRLQLRLGRDLLWYPYARSAGEWEPAGPPQPEPARATETL